MVTITNRAWYLISGFCLLAITSGCVHPTKTITYEEFDHRASTFAGTAVRHDGNFIVGTREPPVYRRNFLGNWVLDQPTRRTYKIDVRDVPPEVPLMTVTDEWRTIPNNPYAKRVEPETRMGEDPPVLRLRNWLKENDWGGN